MQYPGWENLETRRLLSASLNSASKLLTVTGTNARDVIRVALSGTTLSVTINGVKQSFPLANVGQMLINAMNGNDDGQVGAAIKVPATMNGGTGNDLLRGGASADSLAGDAGNDTLDGGAGNDSLDGGAGGDSMIGGTGNDLADYSGRINPVTVLIGNKNSWDGEFGEHDLVGSDIEQVAGGSGADSITGSSAANTLYGNGGNDTLLGGAGNDLLAGGDNNDSLNGQTNDDTLQGGAGDDDMTGGDGTDWADYSDQDVSSPVDGLSFQISADDSNQSGAYMNNVQVEFDTVHSDVENLKGTNSDDVMGAFTDVPHILDGRDGNDFLFGGDANDTLDGGVGNDSLIAGNGADVLTGGPDTIAAGQSDQDYLEADDGADSIIGGAEDDAIIGGAGNDTVDGGAGADNISGEVGADSLSGDAGDDIITGGVDNDTIDGGLGVDSLSGDDDNDVITDPGTTLPNDGLDDSGGDDSSAQPADDTTAGDGSIDTLDGGTGQDSITGGDGQAFLIGSDGDDTIMGGDGDENIDGGLGNDSIDGGGGNDFIDGNFGLDVLNGDDGNDVFDNADGQSDQIDGGDGIDLVQFEPAGTDVETNTEGVYDQPADDGSLQPPPDQSNDNSGVTQSVQVVQVHGQVAKPAVTVSPVTVNKGILTIVGQSDSNGNPLDDNISLSQSGSTITVVENGASYPVSATGLKGISIDAGAGSDFVALASSTGKSTITLPSTILGGKGDDVLRGGAGPDSIIAGLGNDNLSGNDGNDFLNGGLEAANGDSDGKDTFSGGAGEDAVMYTYRTTPLFLSLDGKANDGAAGENDSIGADIEDIYGGRGADSITGNSGANYLSGGTGADTLRGNGGIDKIIANASHDVGDSIFGGASKDVFVMNGDNAPDRYDVGTGGAFLNRDVASNGSFLDTPM